MLANVYNFPLDHWKIGILQDLSTINCPHNTTMLSSSIRAFITKALPIRYNYISKKALDEIQRAHGKTAFQRALMYTKQAKHIAKEGFFSFKKDLEQYFKLIMNEKIDKKALTHEEEAAKRKIAHDLNKLKPIILINILPFSGPLLIFYILTYPTKVPSYFCLDELYDLHQQESVKKQLEAIYIFKQKPLDPNTFNLATQTLDQLKQLSQLLFGDFEDGVVGINKYFKHNPKSYLLHPHFSKHLVIRKIKEQLKKDVLAHQELKELSAEELVLWKYERVMKGEDRVVYNPIVQPNQFPQPLPKANHETHKEQEHTRHSPSHHAPHKTVEHDRHPQKSETRKNK